MTEPRTMALARAPGESLLSPIHIQDIMDSLSRIMSEMQELIAARELQRQQTERLLAQDEALAPLNRKRSEAKHSLLLLSSKLRTTLASIHRTLYASKELKTRIRRKQHTLFIASSSLQRQEEDVKALDEKLIELREFKKGRDALEAQPTPLIWYCLMISLIVTLPDIMIIMMMSPSSTALLPIYRLDHCSAWTCLSFCPKRARPLRPTAFCHHRPGYLKMRIDNFVCTINVDGEEAHEWKTLTITKNDPDSVEISCYIEAIAGKKWNISICRLPEEVESPLDGQDVQCQIFVDGERQRSRMFSRQEYKSAYIYGRRISDFLEEAFYFGEPVVKIPPEPGTVSAEQEMEMVREQENRAKNGGISSVQVQLYAGTIGDRKRPMIFAPRRDVTRKSTSAAKKGDMLISNSTHFGETRYTRKGPALSFHKFRDVPDIKFTFMYKTRLLLEISDIVPSHLWIERKEYKVEFLDEFDSRKSKKRLVDDSIMDVDLEMEERRIGVTARKRTRREVIVID
ncbi:hypothetical protein SeMB42_g01808 [Synchytrium endobioticum]|uniref:DUF7918 domain-containing protein n=1 Tax=Synchytrium endobioticum TaxID=286115 RepID=A0A507DKK5_9FUNG|nr:hypothetical protein SeMB42_g01808 [Synchytrium endobioticum]